MVRDPNARFATAQEFAGALDGWMRKRNLTESLSLGNPSNSFRVGHIVPARETPTLSLDEEIDSISMGKTGTDESWARSKAETPARPVKRKPVGWIAGGVVGLAALVILIGAVVRSRPAPASARVNAEGAAAAAAIPAAPPLTPPPSAPSAGVAAAATLTPIPTSPADGSPSAAASHRRQEPAAKPAAPAGNAPHPPPSAPASKPKASSAPTGFDLGY